MAFPLLSHKHAKDGMFSPQEYMQYLKKIGKYPKFKPPQGMIICYQRSLMDTIIKNHKTKEVDWVYGKMHFIKETKNKIAVIGKFGIGSPAVITLLEELIAFGVKKFIAIGTAGTLQHHLKIGDIVLCTKAIRDEGTSYHYLKSSKYAHASPEMIKKLRASLEKRKQKYSVGISWTIDAPYRETIAEARHYQKEGVATVEMEASALFAVAQYRKAKIGALFSISDSLAELEWKPKFHSRKTESNLEVLYEVARDALLSK